jgi:hypothetical protein
VNQAEVGPSQGMPLWLRIHPKIREWELPSLSPQFDCGFNLGRPEQVGLLGRLGRFWHHGSRTIHVVATDLVLCTIATDKI